ncbi:hypothetical protein B0H17DRAFT_515378 [Mycena rosella]|uniref:Uncharacterized protein n=1 Tax=Mycena rosella TaxID=1033263 RepID=A0AAD7GXM8_MYCRO|nr:hypothetical protein B0H17DRAFT_515378 [Mycena rosella]
MLPRSCIFGFTLSRCACPARARACPSVCTCAGCRCCCAPNSAGSVGDGGSFVTSNVLFRTFAPGMPRMCPTPPASDESAVLTVVCDAESRSSEGGPRLDSDSEVEVPSRRRGGEGALSSVGDAGCRGVHSPAACRRGVSAPPSCMEVPLDGPGEGGRGRKVGDMGVNSASDSGVVENAEMSAEYLDSAEVPPGEGGRGSENGSGGVSDHACINGGERWCTRPRFSVGGGARGAFRSCSSSSCAAPPPPRNSGGASCEFGDGRGVSTSFSAPSSRAGKFSSRGDEAGEPPKRNSVRRSRFFASHSSLMRFAAVGRRSSVDGDCSPGSGEATMARRMSCCCSCTLSGSDGNSPRARKAAFRASCADAVGALGPARREGDGERERVRPNFVVIFLNSVRDFTGVCLLAEAAAVPDGAGLDRSDEDMVVRVRWGDPASNAPVFSSRRGWSRDRVHAFAGAVKMMGHQLRPVGVGAMATTHNGSTESNSFSLTTSASRSGGGGGSFLRRPSKLDIPNARRLVESPPMDGGLELVDIRPRNLNDLMLVPPRDAKSGVGGWRICAMVWIAQVWRGAGREHLPTFAWRRVGKSEGVRPLL